MVTAKMELLGVRLAQGILLMVSLVQLHLPLLSPHSPKSVLTAAVNQHPGQPAYQKRVSTVQIPSIQFSAWQSRLFNK